MPESVPHARIDSPSAWICRWATLIPAGGTILDLACGGGRHARWLAARGYRVLAVDRDPAVAALASAPGITALVADLEQGPWPCPGRRFEGIVVANYLHRPLMPMIVASLAPAGVLIYETFSAGNERYGRPANPAFLLEPGELLEAVRGELRVIAYEDLFVREPRPALVQRICALRPTAGTNLAAAFNRI